MKTTKVKYPCSICSNNVHNNHLAIECSNCNLWSHIKCNNISRKQYKFYQENADEIFFCLKCLEEEIPFTKLNDNEFETFLKFDIVESENDINIRLKPSLTQQVIIDKLNSLIDQNNNCNNDESVSEYDQPISCSYYSCDEFIKANFKSSKNFSILHLNIHSIQLHIEELRILLGALDYKFDIIAISESKLKDDPKIDISLEGYHPSYCTYTEAEKGGTILYVTKDLNFKPRKDLEIYENKELESSFIEIINDKESNNIVGVIYRHPKMDTNIFIENKLSYLMNKLVKENKKNIFIAGDFNFDLLKFSDHQDTANFFNKMTSNLFIPLIIVPTKINTKNDTLIDNIFSNLYNPDAIAGNLTVNISDGHLPSFMITPKSNQNHLPKNHNIYTRDLKNFDRENFLLDLALINWDDLIDANDANKTFDNLLLEINILVDKYLPLKKISKREFKRTYKPWITDGILNSINRKDKLYNRYIKTKNKTNKEDLHKEYKTLRNQVNELIGLSKKNYYGKYFTEHSNNIKKVWQGIKEIVNIKSKNYNSPNSIEVGNDIITDSTKICNHFNDYFSSIAENILKSGKQPILKSYDKYLSNPLGNSFVFDPCDPIEVNLLINELNPSKASGPNGIPTKIMQMISNIICVPLSKTYNISILTETHPDKLKFANVIPVFKKGSRLVISNYRPISLLSNLNKIFEKIMYKRIYAFLDKYDLLYGLQFGFRAKHSTTHTLINITEKIRSALDDGKVTCGIFIDLQKAFDTVNHEILLKKMEYYGFRGKINGWLRSYLCERKQKVTINGFESVNRVVNHGVPQGSVLGPILFLLYINDLHTCIKHSTTYHFADDTNLLNISPNYKTLQKELNEDLRSLVQWLTANKISLNNDKTEIIYFHKANNDIPSDIKIKLNGKKLYPSKKIKYLGVYLDETLSGDSHCEELVKKLNRANGMLAKARHFVPLNELTNIYHAIFSSHLMYGCQIWTQKLLSVTDKISILQKNAVRIMTFSDFKAHSEPLFKQLEILKFKDNIVLQNCLFVYDYLKGNLPNSFDDTFNRVDEIHSIETRGAKIGMLSIPRYKSTTYGLKSIYKNCINSWNMLTREINKSEKEKPNNKDTDIDLVKMFSRNKLKSLITEHFLSSYKIDN